MVHITAFVLLFGQSPTLSESIEKRYSLAAEAGFTGSVLVVKSGKVLVSKAFGMADKSKSRAIRTDTIFPIGSVAKWFTGLIVLKLEQDGKLKLSDPIGKFVSGVPFDKRAITVRQLLAHSAGLREYVDITGEGGDFAPFDKKTAISRILAQKLVFAPGAKSEYSNSGFTLLAAIIEKASGMSYADSVRKWIFKPAGMKRSGFYGDKTWKPDQYAIGYNAKSHGKFNSPYYWGAPTWSIVGAGGIVSTTEDLGKAILALTQGKIVSMASETRMFKALSGMEGYGWIIAKNRAGNPFCNVGGGDDFGFNAAILYMPSEGNLIVSCSSSDTPNKIREAHSDVLKLLQAP